MNSYLIYRDRLNQEYRKAFDQVEAYLNTFRIDDVTKAERLDDLLDLFLSAQEAGKPVKHIVGDNIRTFCRQLVAGFGWKNRLLYVADYLKTMAWTLLGLSVFAMVVAGIEGGLSAALYSTDSSVFIGYVIGLLIGVTASAAAGMIARHAMLRSKKVSRLSLQIIISVAFVVPVFACLWWLPDVFHVPAWGIAAAAGLYLIVYYPLNHRRLKEYKENQVKFSQLIKEETKKQFPDEMEKKYQRANARSVKKGRGELPLRTFLEREERDCRRTMNLRWFYCCLPPAAALLSFVYQAYFDEGFADVESAVFMVILVAAVSGLLLWCLWRVIKTGVNERMAWIEAQYKRLEGRP